MASTTTTESAATELISSELAVDAPFDRAGEQPVEFVDYRPMPLRAIREAWRYRRTALTIFWAVMWQTIMAFRLGPFWLMLQVFMQLVGFSLIFGGGVFNVGAPGGMPYFLFMMVGMMGWQLFLQTLLMSTRGFSRVKMLKNFHLPLLWVPIVGSAQALFRSFLYVVAYLLAILYFVAVRGHLYLQLSPRLLLTTFLGFSLILVFAWGIGMWTAPLFMWAKDVRFVLRLVTPFWMFLTPILYPIDHLRGKTRLLAELNPLASPIEMLKVGLLGAGSVRIYAAIVSTGVIAFVFLAGVWFITRYGQSLVDAGARRFGDDDEDEFM